jgi:hypothetical protein
MRYYVVLVDIERRKTKNLEQTLAKTNSKSVEEIINPGRVRFWC